MVARSGCSADFDFDVPNVGGAILAVPRVIASPCPFGSTRLTYLEERGHGHFDVGAPPHRRSGVIPCASRGTRPHAYLAHLF